MRQDVVWRAIASQTHTLERRKREGAVVGYHRQTPGQPGLQWNVGCVRGEAVSQRLMAGNTHGTHALKWIISDVRQQLSHPPSLLRLDGGYLSQDTLSYLVEQHLYFCLAARYDWILASGAIVDDTTWRRLHARTRLYELWLSRVSSTSPPCFRTILVEKEQEPLPGSKSKKKILRYGILES